MKVDVDKLIIKNVEKHIDSVCEVAADLGSGTVRR